MTEHQAYARELREWRNDLIHLESPAIREDEDLSYKLGYLYHDGTMAYSSRRGNKKFSLIHRWAQSIPLLEMMNIRLPIQDENPLDSYVAISYKDACEMKNRLEDTGFVKTLNSLHADLHYFVQDRHDSTLVHANLPFVKVYSDGKMINDRNLQDHFSIFESNTFYFPQKEVGTDGIHYTFAVISETHTNEVIGKIRDIVQFIRSVRMEYNALSSEYA